MLPTVTKSRLNTIHLLKLSLCLIFIFSFAIKSQAAYLTIEKKKEILDTYQGIFEGYDAWCRWFNELRNDTAQCKICPIDTHKDKELNLRSRYMNKGESTSVPKSPLDVVNGFDQDLITAVANVICEDREFLDVPLPRLAEAKAGDDASLAATQ